MTEAIPDGANNDNFSDKGLRLFWVMEELDDACACIASIIGELHSAFLNLPFSDRWTPEGHEKRRLLDDLDEALEDVMRAARKFERMAESEGSTTTMTTEPCRAVAAI
jgi:hypothetical protein